jgi:hypothetical protein
VRGTQGKRVEFLEAREDTTEAFESAEETFDLVALLINGMIVVLGMQAVGLRGTTGIIPRSSTNCRVRCLREHHSRSHPTTSETVQLFNTVAEFWVVNFVAKPSTG